MVNLVKVRARIAVATVTAVAVLGLVSGSVPQSDTHSAVKAAAISATHVVAKVPVFRFSDRGSRLVPTTPVRLSHMQVMPLVSMRNYVGVAPRGTSADRRYKHAYTWRQSSDDIEEAEARIDRCIRLAGRRYNIHADRIFLVGYGSGGTMALRVAWNNPTKFAGVATIGGPMPTDSRPLRHVKQVRRLPCLLVMSRDSRAYPDTRVCSDLRLLHSAGCTVAIRQYPGDDELTTNMLSDLDRWLMEFVCGGTGC